MNQVHEQCPKIDSGTVLSPKQIRSSAQCAPHPSLHAQAAPRPRAHGRVVGAAAVLWPWPPAVSQGVMTVSWPSAARQRHVAARVLAPCRKTLPCWPGSLCHDTKPGLAIQFPTSLATSVTIQTLYRDTAFCPANQSPVTIQPIVLR